MCDEAREPVLSRVVMHRVVKELGVSTTQARRDVAHVVARGSLVRPAPGVLWPRLAPAPKPHVYRYGHVYVPGVVS